jgi:transitional endoplasmic reticulum ATPase
MVEGATRLVVQEARPRDAGRGIVRLPAEVRHELGVLSGDTVFLEAEQRTAAKVWPADGELAEDAIRVDGETRTNAAVGVGETVTVSAGSVPEAVKIVVRLTSSDTEQRDTAETAVRRALLDRPVAPGERARVSALGEGVEVTVANTDPEGPVIVTEDTTIEIAAEPASHEDSRLGTTYEDIGGLGDELSLVREMVELPLSDPDLFRRLGIDPPRGVLLHGPPGTGKTLIARAVANEADAHFLSVSGPEIVRKYKGESEERLRELFEEAAAEAPAIVFFDELDAIASTRDDDADLETRVVAQLLSLMDGLEERGNVIVIGATNRVDAIDPALRRPGRFDREIEIGVPDRQGRREILEIQTRGMPVGEDVDLDHIAARTHGFVGADLQALTVEAAMVALRRHRAAERTAEMHVDPGDFEQALASAEPSAMRAFVAERPAVNFADIGGLAGVKATLEQAVEWPLAHPELFTETGTSPPTGILLHGPPGTGKTMLAEAIATETGVNFVRVAGPELLDRYVGESEQSVRDLFERARQAAPAIVFLDELDAIAGQRGNPGGEGVTERVVSQLLTELDRAAENPSLMVLAATNRMDSLDRALLRPGRLEDHVQVPPPDETGRREILEIHTRDTPLGPDVDLPRLAARLSDYTGADLAALVRAATMAAIREVTEERGVAEAADSAGDITVSWRHFEGVFEE